MAGKGCQDVFGFAELGRLGDPEKVLSLAREVCEQRLPVKHAVAMVRPTRRGKAPARPKGGLYLRLARTVLDYLAEHPERTPQGVCAVLAKLHAAYHKAAAAG
jgi:hypothetical protein